MLLTYLIAAVAPPAQSQDNATFDYDALGRLVASRTANPSETVDTTIRYDDAGNRRGYAVTVSRQAPGTPNPPSPPPAGPPGAHGVRVVSLPLGGMFVAVLPR